jgi:hypothetical protein
VWPLLHALDEDVLGDLTMLLLLSPEERETSIANRDFEDDGFAKALEKAIRATQEVSPQAKP